LQQVTDCGRPHQFAKAAAAAQMLNAALISEKSTCGRQDDASLDPWHPAAPGWKDMPVVAHRLKTESGKPSKSAADELSRLRSASNSLQATIAERLTSEKDWLAERGVFRAMIDQVHDYLFVKDNQSRFVIANRAVAADLGLQPSDLIGKTDFELHPARLAKKFFSDEQSVIASGEPMIDIEEFVITVSGAKKWFSTSKVPLRNEQHEVIGIVGICRDITDRKRAEDQIHFMAQHDALTALPNRILLMDRLSQALLRAQRSNGRVTVIFIDLDNFKVVNDSLGHNAGDRLLRTVADRMVECVRATDTVARIGGDEFVILLNDDSDRPDASAVIKKIRAAICEPISIEGQLFHVTSSMGIAAYPNDGQDADSLLMNADAAMYRAKETGRDRIQPYAEEMQIAAHEKRTLQEGMRTALERNEFFLLYQPQVDLESGRVFAVEALVRWRHPEIGVIEPARFIPIAEESGLIVRLGDWVLREACRQNKAWQGAGLPPLTMCVNVSARQFREKGWVKRVKRTLKETGMEAKYLELELTESLLMHDIPQAIATMQELQEVGVRFSIDDFGTGYSSLSALKNFPVARLKIDGSFVRNLPHDANDRSIATAIISLGQRLHMDVVAEGVESEEQLAFLRDNHCNEIQGYLFSPPVEPRELEELVRAQTAGSPSKLTRQ
jgi:diguanylate cyclase (GGDEF)-like protein/PAS domain S-box-containing protein